MDTSCVRTLSSEHFCRNHRRMGCRHDVFRLNEENHSVSARRIRLSRVAGRNTVDDLPRSATIDTFGHTTTYLPHREWLFAVDYRDGHSGVVIDVARLAGVWPGEKDDVIVLEPQPERDAMWRSVWVHSGKTLHPIAVHMQLTAIATKSILVENNFTHADLSRSQFGRTSEPIRVDECHARYNDTHLRSSSVRSQRRRCPR